MNVRDNASATLGATPNTNKWNSFDGHNAMEEVYRLGMPEINVALDQLQHQTRVRVENDMEAYWLWLGARPRIGWEEGPPRVRRYAQWARRNVVGTPPFLSKTFGQIFEDELQRRGLKAFQHTPKYTYWTGNWAHADDLLEGFAIRTGVGGFSIVYRENRRYGLSWGPHRSDLKSFGGRGWLTRKTMFSGVCTDQFRVYSHMAADGGTGCTYVPGQFQHGLQVDNYEDAVYMISVEASNLADFMNDRDFHVLEHLKRAIRRSHPNEWMSNNAPLDAQQIELVGEAYVLTEQLHLLGRAAVLYDVWQSGFWNGNPGPGERPIDPVPALMIGSWPPEPGPPPQPRSSDRWY